MTRASTEETDQIAVINWMQMQHPKIAPWLHHSPNGGQRHITTAARLKRMGTRRGFPDLALYVSRGEWAGLVIEMKADKGGRLTPEQRQWLEHLKTQGWKTVVAKGFDAARDAITDYLKQETSNASAA